MAFPLTPLDLAADLDLGSTWTAAKSYLYQRDGMQPPVPATRGRPDEASQANPATAAFEANNRDGRWSPKYPLGAWYGEIGRNTPLRLSVPAESNYLRLEALTARAFVNDDANLHITGSIELRLQVALTDWQGCILAARWDTGASWIWSLNPDGTLTFTWEDSTPVQHGVVSSVPLPFFRGQQALRVVLNAASGTVAFSTAATIDGTYTQLGAAQSGTGGAATSIQAGNSPFVIGYSFTVSPGEQLCGRVYEARMYNGIAGSGGTVAADGIFSAQSPGATSWTDAQGNAWTSSPISDRDYRWHGQLSALPPKWDSTGTDQSVMVTAGGPLRRLGQGQSPVQSAMRRALAAQSGTLAPAACWPCEDAAGATAFGSSVGGTLLNFDGSPQLATDSSFAASAPLPQLNGSRWYGLVPSYASHGSIVLRWLQKAGTAPGSTTPLMRLITTGTATEVTLNYISGGGVSIVGNNSGGAVFSSGLIAAPGGGSYAGLALWMSLELTVSAGTVTVALNMMAPGGVQLGIAAATYSGTVGNVTQVRVNPNGALPDTVIGHVSVQSAVSSLYLLQDPLDAWAGEPAGQRFARLAGENGLQARVIGAAATTALMGPQSTAALLQLLQECEDCDRGLMGEPRQVLGLQYRTLASMLNQSPRVTLDYAQAVLGGVTGGGAPELEPTYDDQRVRNDETVTRGSAGGGGSQGATYQYKLDDGSAMSVGEIGDYDNSDTVNCASDADVPHLASWIVHAGTVDEARWPAIPFNLARQAIQSGSLYYPLLGLDAGDYLEVTNLPGVITSDPVRQLVLGLKESMGGFHHVLELNCAPESPAEVAVFDDLVYGRADTDGSTLHASVSAGATSIQVDTAAGFPVWTQAAADFPFDIAIGGERITVTSITGSSSPQTFTVARAVNGVSKAQAAGADVRLWFPPIFSLI